MNTGLIEVFLVGFMYGFVTFPLVCLGIATLFNADITIERIKE